MTEASKKSIEDKYFEGWQQHEGNAMPSVTIKSVAELIDEQVKKERANHVLDRIDWVNEGIKTACEEIEKSLPSDDELENIKGLENRVIAVYLRNRAKETINKLKKGYEMEK